MRLGRPIPALPTIAVATMALLAAVFVPLFPTYAQANAASCANGLAVPDPADNPGLVSDCAALLSARDTLAGTASLNWSSTTPIDQWDGVTLGGAPQRVTRLFLLGRQLSGQLSPELGHLSNLTQLELRNNQLTGQIPPELGRLANLTQLELSNNQLTGQIPPELGRLTNLTRLTLGNNQLTGQMPPELGRLSNLTWLELAFNRLTGHIPPELGRLANLQWLLIDVNMLTGEIPVELRALSSLEFLILGQNRLTGEIPAELHSLTNLRWLTLEENELTGRIPEVLGSLSNLEGLALGGNQLTGEVPRELGRLVNLQHLTLRMNQLTGEIPAELGNLSDLNRLELTDNRLTGEIPAALGGLDNLRNLSLGRNGLTGQIPAELGNLSNLEALELHHNELTGSIPAELGQLSDLWLLVLAENRLSGPIPPQLGDLAKLVTMDLRGNELSGEIPGELRRLANLTGLYLANNRLAGCIPDRLRALQNNDFRDLGLPFCDPLPVDLDPASCANGTAVPDPSDNPGLVSDCRALLSARGTLDPTGSLNWSAAVPIGDWEGVNLWESPQRVIELALINKQLDGTIPPALGGLSRLRWMLLGGSQLMGGIPAELGDIATLQTLALFGNQLTGRIPRELSSLRSLKELHLGDNELTGEIPAELGSLGNLERLYLSQNRLSGEIPAELGSLTNLRDLSLHHNHLRGEPPAELGKLSNLRHMDLRHNRLSGPVPSWVVRLSNLEGLWLSHNQLTGDIPPELAGHPTLQGLELSNNRLTGQIPAELGSLSSLNWIGLWGNRLAGEIPATLGSLVNLAHINLSGNELSGTIPSELANLAQLKEVRLSRNHLTGCVPGRLREVEHNDLHSLGLPFCDVLLGDLVVSPGSLAPSFDRYHTDYIAEVTSSIVTILAVNVGDAISQVLEADDREVVDADITLPGIQIEIGAGTEVDVRVVAADGGATHTYTIGIRRVLGAPTIVAVEVGGGYLAVSWAARDEFAEARTGSYDLRYIPTAADETADANWTVVENVPTYSADGKLQYTIAGLSAGTQYEVQVRAVDRDGEPAAWSTSVTGTPTTPSVCVTGGAVTGVINTGVVSDCESLLAARDILAGSGRLNWSAGTPIKDWDGVTVGGTPPRVVSLSVNSRGLDGTIPAELGDLTGLQRLDLFENRLTGPIPAELGRLVKLQSLNLSDNRLTGQIPSQLGVLGELRSLFLQRNDLVGVIPSALGFLDDLVEADLSGNNLRGCAPPVANDHTGPPCFVAEGTTLTVDTSYLLTGDRPRITSVGGASNGTVTLDGTTVAYRHDGSETTTGGFTYTVTDGTQTMTFLVAIVVSLVNDPPVGVTDALAVQEGGTVSVAAQQLLDNDSDAEGDTLSITTIGDATNGLVTVDGNTIAYQHDGSETNTGSFAYTVTDGTDTTTVLVTITVSPVNDPPVGVDDALVVQEGDTVSVQALELLDNDSDAEGDVLSITAVGDATNGLVALDGDTIFYRHDGSETKTGSFTYTVTDGAESATASVTISITPVNDPPIGVDDALAVQEGGTVSVQAIELLANDTDAEGDTLSITAVGDATNGLVTLDGNTIFYRHDGSETNAGSFTYTVTDGTDTATVLVTVSVSPVNDPPNGVDDALDVEEGDTVSIASQQLLANDSDAEGDPLSITAVGDAIKGVVTLYGNTISYEHDGSETNADSFTYAVTDGTDTTTVLVTVTVSAANDTPVGVDDTLAVKEGGMVTVQAQRLLDNDTDAEGDALRITAVGDAINGVVTLDGGAISYEHDGSETLTGSFTYTVSDRTDSATVLVTISVSPVDDLPVLLLVTVALGAGLLVVGGLAALAVRRTRRAA